MADSAKQTNELPVIQQITGNGYILVLNNANTDAVHTALISISDFISSLNIVTE